MPKMIYRMVFSFILANVLFVGVMFGQASNSNISGKRFKRIVVRGALVIDGNGTPISGPKDIVIVNDKIERIVGVNLNTKPGERGRPAKGEVEIDATGKYVMPGLINLHGHTQDGRAGIPQPVEYCMKMWLASGITTVRDLGSSKKTLAWRDKSAANEIASPRIFAYGVFSTRPGQNNPEGARARVRELKQTGYDGIKLFGVDRDIMEAMLSEAKKVGLRVAHHAGVAETNAWDDIKFGTTSIEHWYGIPDAAISSGRQNYPASYNYSDEVDRFRYAGRLWREAKWKRLMKVLDGMVEANVAWNPTLDIYEASRDLQRAQTNPAFAQYLHPTLANFFRPDPAHHGSYFIGWTSTDETFWKENYRIWMKALREFERRGGLIGVGEDAGFIYQVYGLGLIRELELHQEAGFHPLKVVQHATGNNAKILGKETLLGRIRTGFKADLLVVNGNPLENFKVLHPMGVEEIRDGKVYKTGGVEWTIKDGIPFHAPTLAKEVREIVAKAKQDLRKAK